MALLLLPGLSGSAEGAGETPATRSGAVPRPNVLIFLTDDQRPDDAMRVMPETRRWFRRGGAEFPNAFATTPLCCPSRSTIFTGLFAHNTGVKNNEEPLKLRQRLTIQRYLQRDGYLTAIAGKFFNAWQLENDPPHFDRWAIFETGYLDASFNINGTMKTVARYSTDFLADRALTYLDWFERQDRQPWFLIVSPYAAHSPWRPAGRHAGAAVPPWNPSPSTQETDLSDKPQFIDDRQITTDRAGLLRRRQLRTLMAVDEMVGGVASHLRDLGESRRTMALFLSDNGHFWAEHGIGDKAMPYTEAVKIPLFMRWPDHVPGGSVVNRMVGTIDIAPTVYQATRTSDLAVRPDGRSLLGEHQRGRMLLEYWRDPGPSRAHIPRWASLRTPTYQYVEYYQGGERSFREYYDLVADPWQLANVLRDGDPTNNPPPDQLDALSAQLSADGDCAGTGTPTPCP